MGNGEARRNKSLKLPLDLALNLTQYVHVWSFELVVMYTAISTPLSRWPLYLDVLSNSRRQRMDSVNFSGTFEAGYPAGKHNLLEPSREGGGSKESTAYNTPQAFGTPESGLTPPSPSSGEEDGRGGAVGFPDPNFNSVKLASSDTRLQGINGVQPTVKKVPVPSDVKPHSKLQEPKTLPNGGIDATDGRTQIPSILMHSPTFEEKSPPCKSGDGNPFSINGPEPPRTVFSSSQELVDDTPLSNHVRGNQEATEEDSAAGMGNLEDSMNVGRTKRHGK